MLEKKSSESDDGNTLKGSWANVSKKKPESGNFTAMRVSSISGQITQGAAPAPDVASGAEITGTQPAPPDASPTAGAISLQAAAGSQASSAGMPSSAKPADEPNRLPQDLPPEYLGPAAEVISNLVESVLQLFFVSQDDAGDETDAVPPPFADSSSPEDTSLQDSGSFRNFFAERWNSL